jgi:FkbM family methyltransferase
MIPTSFQPQPHPFDLLQLHVKKADVIFDIGCANCDELDGLSNLFPQAVFYLFDPDPRWVNYVNDRITTFKAKFYNIAIGQQDGVQLFYQSPDWHPYSGSIRKPTGHLSVHPDITFDTTTTIQVRSLDSWSAEHGIGQIDLIWSDVQGAEVDLIRGGLVALQNTRYFYTEFSATELYEGQIGLDKILQLLPTFVVEAYFENNVLLRNKSIS